MSTTQTTTTDDNYELQQAQRLNSGGNPMTPEQAAGWQQIAQEGTPENEIAKSVAEDVATKQGSAVGNNDPTIMRVTANNLAVGNTNQEDIAKQAEVVELAQNTPNNPEAMKRAMDEHGVVAVAEAVDMINRHGSKNSTPDVTTTKTASDIYYNGQATETVDALAEKPTEQLSDEEKNALELAGVETEKQEDGEETVESLQKEINELSADVMINLDDESKQKFQKVMDLQKKLWEMQSKNVSNGNTDSNLSAKLDTAQDKLDNLAAIRAHLEKSYEDLDQEQEQQVA